MLLLVLGVVQAPDAGRRADRRDARRARPCCSPRSCAIERRAAAAAACGSASCAPAPLAARQPRRAAVRRLVRRASSSSSCSTCRSCAAGRRSRPAWRCSSSASTRSSPPRSRRGSSRRFGTVPVILAGMVLARRRLRAVPAARRRLDLRRDAADADPLGVAFALAYGPLTIAATDGVAEAEQGLAGGLLNMSLQFGAALGLAVVTAVNVAATGAAAHPRRCSTATARRSSCRSSAVARRRGDHGERSACAAGGAAGVCLNAASAGSRST